MPHGNASGNKQNPVHSWTGARQGLHHGLKTDINYRILIDDKPDVLEDCSHRAGIILHPDFQYCRNAPGLAYHTWEDVPRLIREHEDSR